MATDATANQPTATASSSPLADIKPATPELVALFNQTVPIELMTDLIFEDIGGQELINISRNDILNGESVIYSPIKNITSINLQYNPQNILALQDYSLIYFKNFPIRLDKKIPNIGTGPNGETMYIEAETGDLVINFVNMDNQEQVEIQTLQSGTILNDTIYGVNN